MVLNRNKQPLNVPFVAASIALTAQLLGALPSSPERVSREVFVMGTLLRGEAEAPSQAAAEDALEAAIAEVERWQGLLSTWDPATPLSTLNHGPVGTATPIPLELAALLAEVFPWVARTARAFDPAVGALVDAWDLRGPGRVPTSGERMVAMARTGIRTFELDPEAGTVTRVAHGAWIDTGAFGKGAALRAAADTLRSRGVTWAALDLGGQWMVLGPPEWSVDVAVAHPIHRASPAVTLTLHGGHSVATSGNSERGITVDGRRLGHLLDPRTGLPAPDWGSVSVVSADPLVADILSTALYVMGPEAGLAWAEQRDDVGVLFLVSDGDDVKTLLNQAMTRWLVQPPATTGSPDIPAPERRLP